MTETKQISRGLSIIIVVLISLLISFVTSYVSYFYIFPEIEKKHFVVETPDVRKISLTEAISRLSSHKLGYKVIEEVESEDTPTGTVIYQLPLPKTNVRTGQEVVLMVSKGIPVIYVPKLKNKTLNEAKSILLQLGLILGNVKEVESEEIKQPGFVLDSYPQEGTSVKKGTVIELVVSKTPVQIKNLEMVVTPNIVGKSLVEGQKILTSRGLRLGKVKKTTNENFDFDMILEQKPSAGQKIASGSGVDITLNAEAE